MLDKKIVTHANPTLTPEEVHGALATEIVYDSATSEVVETLTGTEESEVKDIPLPNSSLINKEVILNALATSFAGEITQTLAEDCGASECISKILRSAVQFSVQTAITGGVSLPLALLTLADLTLPIIEYKLNQAPKFSRFRAIATKAVHLVQASLKYPPLILLTLDPKKLLNVTLGSAVGIGIAKITARGIRFFYKPSPSAPILPIYKDDVVAESQTNIPKMT